MVSSGDGTANNNIDPAVGGLVWVRRRNGSWWPGRILGDDELPEGCMVTPRIGTPVKLLGRDDASVDWYNLDKSKRIKAFRCGEYDACIEKAKAAAANSSRKSVKYARREDAIIHALELESARESKDHADFCSTLDKPSAEEVVKGSPSSFQHEETEDMAEELSSSEDNSNSAQELSQSGVSFEEPNHVSVCKAQVVQGKRRRTPNDSEDDGMEGVKRMKGLEDLGMGMASSVKRKRSQVAKVHEFLKRKNRRRQLTKVLESTAMMTAPVMCEQLTSPMGSSLLGVSDSKLSGVESNESKRSFSVVINNNSDSTCENGISLNASEHVNCKQKENEISSMLGLPESDIPERLFDVPLVGEDNLADYSSIPVSCAYQEPQLGQSSQSSLNETLSLGNEEFNESGSFSSGAADTRDISHRVEKDTSKWQSKGKRNIRHTSKKRKYESSAYLPGMEPQEVVSIGSGRKIGGSLIGGLLNSDTFSYGTQVDEFQGWTRHTRIPAAELSTPQRTLPYRQSRFTVNPKYQTSDLSHKSYGTDYLYDVTLEVKSSYRPQHVPYISLMSKLNGQPVIGHPLAVEVLDEGFCDLLMGSSECYSSSYELQDDLGEDISAWRGIDMIYEAGPSRGDGRSPTKRLKSQQRISSSKSPKSRKNGLLLKKTRKLSSLTAAHKLSAQEMKPVVEKLKGPSVACVPLKVVFSRINAALNSSMRPVHRLMADTQ
ncbi:hypothetical protein RJ640_008515 [Escallonia rubra]|uniref:PWWP domain-containing protein n=1 Tax=Escallonia rubra TaxID=112253 RepID=A0AA88R6X5_9ASTE|nr:hypothetical protein RJ640_008515 [Escallonia rubra]